MYVWLIFAIGFALLEALAVSRDLRQIEYIAKPAVMCFLFVWLSASTALRGNTLWFGLGILLSLAGDVFLLFPSEKLFLSGLIAFLLAHILYIIGFREALMTFNHWSLILALLIAIPVSLLLKRIVKAMRTTSQRRLIVPVLVYGVVISLMLYAAVSTFFTPLWKTGAAWLVSAGAFLFVLSDSILAWNRFVSLLKKGRVWNITLYHLGQIGLIAGVIVQYAQHAIRS